MNERPVVFRFSQHTVLGEDNGTNGTATLSQISFVLNVFDL